MKKRPENITRYLLEPSSPETSLLLRCHLLLEVDLERAITRAARNPSLLKIEEARFAQKIRIAAGFGVVDARAAAALDALNSLRNKMAHRVGFEVTAADIAALKKHVSEPPHWEKAATSPMIAERTPGERELLRFVAWLGGRIGAGGADSPAPVMASTFGAWSEFRQRLSGRLYCRPVKTRREHLPGRRLSRHIP